jgi:hypothetical protein
MIIRRFILTVATQDDVSQKAIEDCVDHGLELIPGAHEYDMDLESERGSKIDQGVDPYSTIEENDKWSGLANKELKYGRTGAQDPRPR